MAPITRPEDRHGQFLVRQLNHAQQRQLYDITLSSQNVLSREDLEGREPFQRGDISYLSLLMMLEVLAFESFSNFMEIYAPRMQYNISYGDYDEVKLALSTILENNRHITSANFEDVEEPDLVDDDPNTPLPRPEGQFRGDPEYKGSVESLCHENKHIILETDDDDLVECTLKWLRMCNKNVQKKIMERVVKAEAKEEQKEEEVEIEEEEEDQEPPDPKLPAPTTTSMECQTEESFLSGLKAGSSSQKEEPVPPEGSSEKEESGEQKTAKGSDIQHDDTAPKEKPVQ